MTYYSALHYAAKAEKSASTAVEAAEIAKQLGNDRINQTHITNCITEIPQDIKLELNSGVISAKAGSKIRYPDGKNDDGSLRFGEIVLESDIAVTSSVKNKMLVFINNSKKIQVNTVSNVFSGTTAPTGLTSGVNYIWYDTTNNIVKLTTNAGSSWTSGFSLPLGLITGTGTITSIDQIFNGFGYIGSTVFALPGVKGLIPNGRNEDGSLKNIEVTLDGVKTYTFASNYNNDSTLRIFATNVINQMGTALIYVSETAPTANASMVWYRPSENKIYFSRDKGVTWAEDKGMFYATCKVTNGVISNFSIKQPFHAVDRNDLIVKADKSQFQVVSTLPSSPQPDVFYFIPE